jgi:hypothetical protein
MDQQRHFRPLETAHSIRILHVDHRQQKVPFRYRMSQLSLDQVTLPRYHCLSYTWGNPVPEHIKGTSQSSNRIKRYEIYLEEIGAEKENTVHTITISSNLHDFLVQLNEDALGAVPLIWIDAVCINQSDMAEKVAQVKLMDRVYTLCYKAICWLGPHDYSSRMTKSIFRKLEDIFYDHQEQVFRQAMQDKKSTGHFPLPDFLESLGLGDISQNEWYALGELFQRSWFHRVWTLQEMLLPPRISIWCGGMAFGIAELSYALRCYMLIPREEEAAGTIRLFGNRNGIKSPKSLIPTLMLTSLNGLRYQSFMVLRLSVKGQRWCPSEGQGHINWVRQRQCSESRDYVYGALGLLPIKMPVDYQKSRSDVFVEFTHAFGVAKLVPYDVEHRQFRRTSDLPSWVPDFASPQQPSPWVVCGGRNHYHAGGPGDFEPVASSSPRILVVRGVLVDTIKAIGGKYSNMESGQCFVDCLTALSAVHCPATGQAPMEMLWRTLCINLNRARIPPADIWEPSFLLLVGFFVGKWLSSVGTESQEASAFQRVLESLKSRSTKDIGLAWSDLLEFSNRVGTKTPEEAMDPEERRQAEVYAAELRINFEHRCFFITEENRIGIGPSDLQPGTHICLVQGCQYPWLLEKTSSGRSSLIGHGYVAGLMHGEGLEDAAFTDLEIE